MSTSARQRRGELGTLSWIGYGDRGGDEKLGGSREKLGGTRMNASAGRGLKHVEVAEGADDDAFIGELADQGAAAAAAAVCTFAGGSGAHAGAT